MFKDEFYIIREMAAEESGIRALIALNAGHSIFEGHFPGQPVVPGVCMIQIVRELLENRLQSAFSLVHADQIKFLAVIDPGKTPEFMANLQFQPHGDGQVKVSAHFNNGEMVYFKMQGGYFKTAAESNP